VRKAIVVYNKNGDVTEQILTAPVISSQIYPEGHAMLTGFTEDRTTFLWSFQVSDCVSIAIVALNI
jgi:hypothetical protein